ncbi:MAG: NAD(P)/FAD-dependent oxidoreductase [Peptococcaceae bacterium]|nr:NAD(P)/FAD-dependent oxidoreductase [Peptococcaceae bacterium]
MGKIKKPLVAIIGGGASGLVAAILAKNNGAEVIILEQMDRVGKKILATGNGRCNISNTDLDISNYFGKDPQFARAALGYFNFQRTEEFFENLGIAYKVEEEGKVFPYSEQASSVLDVLRYELERIGVEILCDSRVDKISGNANNFTLTINKDKKINADRIIIATGGKAAPNLGSNGSGYVLAKNLGHKIIEPFPALVQLKLESPFLKALKGIKFIGTVEITPENNSPENARGEILFTEYGISGPPILSLSRCASESIKTRQKVLLKISIIDTKSEKVLAEYLNNRFEKQKHKTIFFSLVGFINKKLIPVILKEAGIENIHQPVHKTTPAERERIGSILQKWEFPVIGTNSWKAAQVTAGGISTREINADTMESKLCPGIFFAGEVIDIDGACGGYNLQWAWSSGAVAGQNAAKEIK